MIYGGRFMRKSIKRIYALLCMVVMFVMMIPAMAFAAEADETKVAINVKVPDDWQNPCVWAWDEDGNNAFEAWPGEECEATPANEGWYYVWVPDWANHVIVNANAGEVQTGELVLDGKDAWITVSDADNAEISYDAQTTGDTPEYTEKFLIHAKVDDSWENPNLRAWSAPDGTNAFASWPGEALEENNGWLTKEIPGWVNSIIVNGNDGSVQTSDISIETEKDVWVVVTDAENYEVTYEEPDATAIDTTATDAAAEETTTETVATENTQQSSTPVVLIIIIVIVLAVIVATVVTKKKSK